MFKIALSKSKELIKGKRLTLWGVILIYFGVLIGISVSRNIVLVNIACFLIGLPLAFGFMKYLINLYHKKEKLEDLIYYFENYTKNFKLLLATLWYTLIVTIGLILFVVPGIIWMYRYILVYYILITDERVSIKKSFEMSKEKMHGHKFKYFAAPFVLTIAPLVIIAIGTCFVGFGAFNGVKENPTLLDDFAQAVETSVTAEVKEVSGVDITYDFTGLEEVEEPEVIEETADAEVIDINHKTNLGNIGSIILGTVFLGAGYLWLILIYPRLLMVETTYACELLAKDKKEE